MESWASGDFQASFKSELIARYAGAAATCAFIKEISNYDADEFLE